MPAIQNLVMKEAEDRTFTLYARDWSNTPLSLTGATLEWRVGKGPYSIGSSWATFTKPGTITDSTNGAYTVAVAMSDTQWICGDYRHETWMTLSGQSSMVNEGRLRIGDYIRSS